MNRDAKCYLKNVKRLIPRYTNADMALVKSLNETVRIECESNPGITYEELCEKYGSPKEICLEQMEAFDDEELFYRLRRIWNIKRMALIALVIVLVACGIHVGMLWDTYMEEESIIHGYGVEEIY